MTKGSDYKSKPQLFNLHTLWDSVTISDCLPDKVIIFKKGENPTRPKFNTFGTSIGIITSKIFKSNRTIGDFSSNQIKEFEKFFKELNYNDALSILNAKVGDSVEKLLFINEMKNKYYSK